MTNDQALLNILSCFSFSLVENCETRSKVLRKIPVNELGSLNVVVDYISGDGVKVLETYIENDATGIKTFIWSDGSFHQEPEAV